MAASSKISSRLVAALVVMLLAALLAATGPAAADVSSRPGCFVGWSALNIVPTAWCLLRSFSNINLFGSPKATPTGDGLSVGHYNQSGTSHYCPRAEQLVWEAVYNATTGANNRGLAAGLIRLHFHDAFVRGCDASVLLDKTASGNTDTEKTGNPNRDSLRGFNVIDAAKAALEAACPGVVSCADILAFAARDASKILSDERIDYDVPAGRYDGRQSFASETDQLPGPDSTVQQLNDSFTAQGLTLEDAVTLSGAHSVGLARCMFFTGRLSAMDPGYAANLSAACSAGPSTRVNQDNITANVLDKQYYKNIDKFVLFASDAALSSTQTIGLVNTYKDDYYGVWEKAFADAMVKMGKIGVATSPGPYGAFEIRKVCSQVN